MKIAEGMSHLVKPKKSLNKSCGFLNDVTVLKSGDVVPVSNFEVIEDRVSGNFGLTLEKLGQYDVSRSF